MRYCAVFYKGNDEILSKFPPRETREKAQSDIDKENEIYSVFKYTPWTKTEIVEE